MQQALRCSNRATASCLKQRRQQQQQRRRHAAARCAVPLVAANTSSSQQQRRRHAAAHCAAPQAAVSTSSSPAAAIEQQPGWAECLAVVQELGVSEQDAATYIQRAFGWGARARAYWRHDKSEAPPEPGQVRAALAYLAELGMSDEQRARCVKLFPEVLGCDVPGQLQANVGKLQAEWRLQGSVLLGAVMRNPAVLGYNLDCMGDCAGECNRCWARF